MGMVWIARLADDDQTAALRADPDGLGGFIAGEDLDWSAMGEARSDSHDPRLPFDVDKQWHAIHYLLTGSPEPVDGPLGVIMGSFEDVGEDQGYATAWFIPAAYLKACHEALESTSDEVLRQQYDPEGMVRERIYLGETLAKESDEALGFLLEDVRRLRAFVRAGAERSLNAFAFVS